MTKQENNFPSDSDSEFKAAFAEINQIAEKIADILEDSSFHVDNKVFFYLGSIQGLALGCKLKVDNK